MGRVIQARVLPVLHMAKPRRGDVVGKKLAVSYKEEAQY